MAAWTVYCIECATEAARGALMDRLEQGHPVEFPDDHAVEFEDDRYSVLGAVDLGDGPIEADFAWIGRYLYVTTTEPADDLVLGTMGDWERAAIGEFDATTGTAEHVTLVLDADAGEDDEVAGGRFRGVEGLGGMDVLYSLAMRHQFRFRSYSALPPERTRGPHPDAFTAVDAVETFVADMAEATGVEPTDAGIEFLRADPGHDERYVFGETYGPVDREFEDLDAVPLDDAGRPATELPRPADVLGDDERPGADGREGGGGLLGRLRRRLGL